MDPVAGLGSAQHPSPLRGSVWEHGPTPGARRRRGTLGLGLGSGQLVGSFEHLHEEGVDGGVANELEEKQMF